MEKPGNHIYIIEVILLLHSKWLPSDSHQLLNTSCEVFQVFHRESGLHTVCVTV